MKSLIQQRMAIQRQRLVGIAMVVLGVLEVIFGVDQVFFTDPARWSWVFFGAIGLGFIAAGITNLAQSQRKRVSLETEHGADAGKQKTPNDAENYRGRNL